MTTPTGQDTDQKRERLRKWMPNERGRHTTATVNHIAVFAMDLEATAAFYSEVMDVPVVNVTPNRDLPESTHMNIDLGSGVMLSFFDFPDVPRLRRRAPEGVGGVMHIALAVAVDRIAEVKGKLTERRVKFQEIGGSLYFKDPNGLGIELMPR